MFFDERKRALSVIQLYSPCIYAVSMLVDYAKRRNDERSLGSLGRFRMVITAYK